MQGTTTALLGLGLGLSCEGRGLGLGKRTALSGHKVLGKRFLSGQLADYLVRSLWACFFLSWKALGAAIEAFCFNSFYSRRWLLCHTFCLLAKYLRIIIRIIMKHLETNWMFSGAYSMRCRTGIGRGGDHVSGVRKGGGRGVYFGSEAGVGIELGREGAWGEEDWRWQWSQSDSNISGVSRQLLSGECSHIPAFSGSLVLFQHRDYKMIFMHLCRSRKAR